METDTALPPAPALPAEKIPPVEEKPQTIAEHVAATAPEGSRRRRPADDARPEDREEISTLTARLREAEKVSGIERKPNESNRVYDLRVRTELAERLAKAQAPKPAAVAPKPLPLPRQPQAGAEFTEPEPTLSQFKESADPAKDYFLALGAWDRKREAFETQKTRAQQDGQQTEAQFKQWWKDRDGEHVGRLRTYLDANPKAKAEMESFQDGYVTPVVYASIITHPESAKLLHAFVKNPELADELFLLTHGKQLGDPTSNPLVASVQRRLLAKAQTVQLPERSPAPAWKPPAPPPTPVRTQPTATATPTPDKDGGLSVMSHAKKFHAKDID